MLQLSMQVRNSKVEMRKSYRQRTFSLKSSNLKRILFFVYFIANFFCQNEYIHDAMNLCLYGIQIWRMETKVNISNTDRFDLTISGCALIARFTIPQLQGIILSLSFFSFKNNLSTMLRSFSLLKRIKNLSITILFIMLLTAYLFTYLYHSYEATSNLFGTFSRTCITMLEILTLDVQIYLYKSWGSRGRVLEQQVGYTGMPSLIICGYVFLMNYFYMNILIGLILEAVSVDHDILEPPRKKNYSLDYFLGQVYQQIVMIFSITSVFFNIYNNFIIVDTMGKIFDVMDDIFYTIHFILLLFIQTPRIEYERSKWERMLLHFIAGPLALFLSHDLACLCNLCKLATTPLVRGVFSGTINIFPILFPIVIFLLGIILMMAVIMNTLYSQFIGFKGETYFTTIRQAFYTFVQLLTLDDWDANVLPIFGGQHIFPYVIIPLFIVVSNVILLNILIACSCRYFSEVDYSIIQPSISIGQNNTLRKLNDVAQLKIPLIKFRLPQTDSENYLKQREGIVQISFKNKTVTALLIN